jgi:hypothetical protein
VFFDSPVNVAPSGECLVAESGYHASQSWTVGSNGIVNRAMLGNVTVSH